MKLKNGKFVVSKKDTKMKMLIELFKCFFTITTIHGLSHVTKGGRHPVERFIWLILVISAVCAGFKISSMTLKRYIENPTVISMERDQFSWNTTFPSVTICPNEKVNMKLLEEYLDNATDIKDKDRYRQFIKSLLNASYLNFDEIIEYKGISGEDFIDLIRKFHFTFKPIVSSSILIDKQFGIQSTMTEMGLCYSFNSQLAVYNSLEYWNTGSWKLLSEIDIFYINPMDGEVFASVVNMSTGCKVYFHGPYETVDIASKHTSSHANYFTQMYLSGITIFSSERTKDLGVLQRKCRFYFESNLRYSPVYSYVLCRMDCRALLTKKLCGCLPHFYRKLDGDIVCNLQGLHCLSKYKGRFICTSKAQGLWYNIGKTYDSISVWTLIKEDADDQIYLKIMSYLRNSDTICTSLPLQFHRKLVYSEDFEKKTVRLLKIEK